MAVVEEVSKLSVKALVNNGSTASGTIKTLAVSLGTMNPSRVDNAKYWAIIEALAPCFVKSYVSTQKDVSYKLSSES